MGHGHSRRAHWRISGAVFSGLFAISKLDGLVDHPGDHDADFPALVQSIQPKTVDLARQAQSIVASVGGSMLLFLISFVVANVIMAYGDSAERSGRAIFSSVAGSSRGESLAKLSIATLSRKGLSVSPLFRRCLSD